MAEQRFEEPLQLNNDPINQLSKQAIKSLGQNPDPEDLYWRQLLTFSLDSGLVQLPRPEMYPWVEAMDRLKPQQLQDFLEVSREDGERYPVVKGNENLEPRELAERILDRQETNIQTLKLGYVNPTDSLL